jgi:hypothetical protein
VYMFTDSNIEFLQNVQSCGRKSLWYKTEADELQECAVPWSCPDAGVTGDNADGDKSDTDKEVDFKAMCHEDILMLLEEPVENTAYDEHSDFLSMELNGFSFDKIRNKGVWLQERCQDTC